MKDESVRVVRLSKKTYLRYVEMMLNDVECGVHYCSAYFSIQHSQNFCGFCQTKARHRFICHVLALVEGPCRRSRSCPAVPQLHQESIAGCRRDPRSVYLTQSCDQLPQLPR